MWTLIIMVALALIMKIIDSYESANFETQEQVEKIGIFMLKIVTFIPYMVLGIIFHIAGDFKNHKLGYMMLFIIFGSLSWAVYMGISSGPASPAPWE